MRSRKRRLYRRVWNLGKFQIRFYCKYCHRPIDTFWENDELQGAFLAEAVIFSEYLQRWVVDPRNVICFSCYNGV